MLAVATMVATAGQIVGRTAELGSLDGVLTQLPRDGPAALEIVGEPGIGKTLLLGELAARADARGYLVLAGGAAEQESDHPIELFVEQHHE